MTAGALEGLRVLELAEGWSAAALAGRLLGELGALVVKVESPDGDPLRAESPRAADGQSLAFHLVAATKESVALDGRSDRRAMDTLSAWADVLVADTAGLAALRAMGVDVAALPDASPHLVACAITPFGLRGPLAGFTAGELTVQAMSGVMACTGYPDRPPTRAGVPLGAHLAALLAAAATLAAVRVVEGGGRGQLVDMAIHDCLVSGLGTFLPGYFLTGRSPSRLGNRHPIVSPWNAYRCRDGWALICAANERQWASLLRVIGRPDLVGDVTYGTVEARVREVDAVDALITAWAATRTVAELVAMAEGADVPAGPIATMGGLLANAHFRARQMLVEVDAAGGARVPTVGPLFKMSLTPGRVERAAPVLGEATAEVLRAAEGAPRKAPRSPGRPERPPLQGVRVLEMGSFTAGPFGARLLAAVGADVVKIEPRGGEPARHLAHRLGGDSYLFHLNNTDKRGVTLDPASREGRELLLALVRRSDAFIENFSVGTAKAWGLGPDDLLAANPRLLYCSTSGFGQHGPLATRRAYDTVVQAAAGVMSLTGHAGDPPVKIGLSVADLLGPCLSAAALLAALRHRDSTGRGQHLDVSLHDVTSWLTAVAWPAILGGAGEPERRGNRHSQHVPENAYAGADGESLVIEVRDDAEWARLAAAMKREDLARDAAYATAAARRGHADEVDQLVGAWVAERTAVDAVRACQEARVAAGPVLSLAEVATHAHTLAREMVVVREHPALGPIRLLGVPLKLTRPEPRVTRTAPALGAHNAEVYGELAGQSAERLQALRAAGVV